MRNAHPIQPAQNQALKGKIIAYCADVTAGVIRTMDGQQFLFFRSDWRNPLPPAKNMPVAFEPRARAALNVCAA